MFEGSFFHERMERWVTISKRYFKKKTHDSVIIRLIANMNYIFEENSQAKFLYLLNLMSFLSSLETWPKLYLLIDPGVLISAFILSSKACILTWSFFWSSFSAAVSLVPSSFSGNSISVLTFLLKE